MANSPDEGHQQTLLEIVTASLILEAVRDWRGPWTSGSALADVAMKLELEKMLRGTTKRSMPPRSVLSGYPGCGGGGGEKSNLAPRDHPICT